ncbi:hypothetical protein MNAN1_000567 [Malassezia nana]|uniref:Uncharacterized protein n=1 Tax=Malassezia nana TaxID=180528 RepID=A0AAF0EJ32_9BASI|nr:hypothetical protein MNAN1_000567 [Malassezia nana]
MTARKAPASAAAGAPHSPPRLLCSAQKAGCATASITDTVVAHPAPPHGAPQRRGDRQSSRSESRQLTPILVAPADVEPSALQTQLLASLERDAERKGTKSEPIPTWRHVSFGEPCPTAPTPSLPYEVRRAIRVHTPPSSPPAPARETLCLTETGRAPTRRRPLRLVVRVAWEWRGPRRLYSSVHANDVWAVARERVYDALLYQLDSVDRPHMQHHPWTVARRVLTCVPPSVLWWMYQRLQPRVPMNHTLSSGYPGPNGP